MSTLTGSPRPAQTPTPTISPSPDQGVGMINGEQGITIRNVTWDLYDRLTHAIGESQHIYVAYDGTDLEIVTTGIQHDDLKEMLGWFVKILTSELQIRFRRAGQTTWKRPEIARVIESDLCYFFSAEKLADVAEARRRNSYDIADYPKPDLAPEIDISPTEIGRTPIYAALHVSEVWRVGAESIVIEQLQPDGPTAHPRRASSSPSGPTRSIGGL